MLPSKIEAVLCTVLRPQSAQLDPPSIDDWQRIEAKFGCRFGENFKLFTALMSRYQFPGEILNVSSGKTNGDDSNEVIFDSEAQEEYWDASMIPFSAIGNGDDFCVNKCECPFSKVYYFFHERAAFEPYVASFEDWVREIPHFLG